jgi:hypothetical protein
MDEDDPREAAAERRFRLTWAGIGVVLLVAGLAAGYLALRAT